MTSIISSFFRHKISHTTLSHVFFFLKRNIKAPSQRKIWLLCLLGWLTVEAPSFSLLKKWDSSADFILNFQFISFGFYSAAVWSSQFWGITVNPRHPLVIEEYKCWADTLLNAKVGSRWFISWHGIELKHLTLNTIFYLAISKYQFIK